MKEFLSQRGVRYTERDVSVDRNAAAELNRLTGQMAVPVTVVDGAAIVGFDRTRLEQALRSTSARRPSFGLRIADASRMAQKQGTIPLFGAYVARVASGSPGEAAGLRPGDIVTEFNMRTVSNAGDLERSIAGLLPGGGASIVFFRGDQKLTGETSL